MQNFYDTAATELSPRYSFRYNGKALRIYRGDDLEQATLDVGGSFSWTDDQKGYSLELSDVKTGDPIDGAGADGPFETCGVFILTVGENGTFTHSTVEIGA